MLQRHAEEDELDDDHEEGLVQERELEAHPDEIEAAEDGGDEHDEGDLCVRVSIP